MVIRSVNQRSVRSQWLGVAPLVAVLLLSGCAEPAPEAATPPVAPVLSAAESEQMLTTWLDGYWDSASRSSPGLERPDVARVRIVDWNEFPQAQATCLSGLGFEAKVDEAGRGVEVSAPTAQDGALDLAQYTCAAQYPLNPIMQVPLSKTELAYVYSYWDKNVRSCLTSEGVVVSEAPSLDTFVDSYPNSWSPYEDVPEGKLSSVLATCPEYPEDFRRTAP